MKLLKNPIFIIAVVLIIGLGAWYFLSAAWKEYVQFGAMRFVDRSGHRAATDPLFYSTGIFVTEEPKAKAGQTVEVKSKDGLVNKRFMILDIVQEMRAGKANGWWIATDGSWGWNGDFPDAAKGGGQYRII
jgi:hypothetical protein